MDSARRPLADPLAPLRAWWATLARRERLLLALAAAAVVLYVGWAFALQPALRTVRDVPARIDRLDAELQTMRRLAAEVRELRAAVPLAPGQAAAALKAASDRLGARARLVQQGERAVLTLDGASGEQLRGWLAEARSGARARPLEANLKRNADGLWSGTVVVAVGAGS